MRVPEIEAATIQRLRQLPDDAHILDLSQSTLSPVVSAALLACLYKHPRLETLIVTRLSAEPFRLLLPARLRNPQLTISGLQTLDLSHARYSSETLALLNEILESSQHTLKELILQDMSLDTRTLQRLLFAIQHCSHLKALDLSHNRFTDILPSAVKTLIHHLPALKRLVLQDCALETEALQAIAEVLASNPALRELNLTNNAPDFPTALKMIAAISLNSKLQNFKFLPLQNSDVCLAHAAVLLTEVLFESTADNRMRALEQINQTRLTAIPEVGSDIETIYRLSAHELLLIKPYYADIMDDSSSWVAKHRVSLPDHFSVLYLDPNTILIGDPIIKQQGIVDSPSDGDYSTHLILLKKIEERWIEKRIRFPSFLDCIACEDERYHYSRPSLRSFHPSRSTISTIFINGLIYSKDLDARNINRFTMSEGQYFARLAITSSADSRNWEITERNTAYFTEGRMVVPGSWAEPRRNFLPMSLSSEQSTIQAHWKNTTFSIELCDHSDTADHETRSTDWNFKILNRGLISSKHETELLKMSLFGAIKPIVIDGSAFLLGPHTDGGESCCVKLIHIKEKLFLFFVWVRHICIDHFPPEILSSKAIPLLLPYDDLIKSVLAKQALIAREGLAVSADRPAAEPAVETPRPRMPPRIPRSSLFSSPQPRATPRTPTEPPQTTPPAPLINTRSIGGNEYHCAANGGMGDCFFMAVAQALGERESEHRRLRREACDYLQNHQELFVEYPPPPGEEVDDFIRRMREELIYAENPVPAAMAKHLNIHLKIFMIDSRSGRRTIINEYPNAYAGDSESNPPLMLLLRNTHYEWLPPHRNPAALIAAAEPLRPAM